MKLTYSERKSLEQQEILKRARDAGVKAYPRGANHVELDSEQFERLVDQRERFAELLQAVLASNMESRELLPEIYAALQGR
jgi:hypothetical protein